ncbi:MAG: thermonuclease family protein [Acidobacteria bacterium]|nr:thermonuclease family protein [Acidobacteriota bacterium]
MSFVSYPVPHLLGRISYPPNTKFRPDGDTVHLLDPVLLVDGQAIPPSNNKFSVFVTGSPRPKTITLKSNAAGAYAPIRFEGLDAPEEHYKATPFDLTINGHKQHFPLDPSKKHEDRSQPLWSPATRYALNQLEGAGWALVMLDRQVVDKYRRVLGYVWASNASGEKKKFVSLELVKRGLAFPFLFESATEFIPTFLGAARTAKQQGKGVWKNYQHAPLPFSDSFPAPKKHTDAEPAAQKGSRLNLPMVFRRVVDAQQLKNLGLKRALRKYDAIDFVSGDVAPGDRYTEIPIERLIWAPHQF